MYTYRFSTRERAMQELAQWTNPLNRVNWEAVVVVQETEGTKEYIVLVDKR